MKHSQIVNRLVSFFKRGSHADEVLVQFQDRIGYYFKDMHLLVQSLTHKSHVSADDKKRLASNERFEFLGDSVLNCLVTDQLCALYPDYSEGQLSKMKSLLVSRKILGEIGASIDLGYYMIMGMSERNAGGKTRMSIISNAFEAVIGAVYLDGGFESARKVLKKLLYSHFDRFLMDEENVNYKSRILELAQSTGLGIPQYPLIEESGPDHSKRFVVAIEVAGVRLGIGEGLNKKIAQQNAAKDALENYEEKLGDKLMSGDRSLQQISDTTEEDDDE